MSFAIIALATDNKTQRRYGHDKNLEPEDTVFILSIMQHFIELYVVLYRTRPGAGHGYRLVTS